MPRLRSNSLVFMLHGLACAVFSPAAVGVAQAQTAVPANQSVSAGWETSGELPSAPEPQRSPLLPALRRLPLQSPHTD